MPLSFALSLSASHDPFPVLFSHLDGSPHSQGSLRILLRRPHTFPLRNPFFVFWQTSSHHQLAEPLSRRHLFQPHRRRRTESHPLWGRVLGGVCWLPNTVVLQKTWKRKRLHVSRGAQQCTSPACPRRRNRERNKGRGLPGSAPWVKPWSGCCLAAVSPSSQRFQIIPFVHPGAPGPGAGGGRAQLSLSCHNLFSIFRRKVLRGPSKVCL